MISNPNKMRLMILPAFTILVRESVSMRYNIQTENNPQSHLFLSDKKQIKTSILLAKISKSQLFDCNYITMI